MVDINVNNCYAHTGSLDFCLGQFSTGDELSLDDIDCLENLDENDLLDFTNCDDLNYSLLPDTPPETPINYNNCNGAHSAVSDSPPAPNGGRAISRSFSLQTEGTNSTNSPATLEAFSPNSQLNLANIAVANGSITNSIPANLLAGNQHAVTSSITHPTLIIPQSPSAPSIATCISPPSLVIPAIVNCQPVLSTIDLNGFQQHQQPQQLQLNGPSLVYPASLDTSSASKSPIQPKSILPSQVSPKLAKQQKELLTQKQALEARKLRNREAALNSRLKKKEYVEGLEENVKKLTKERDDLLAENKLLRGRVKELESRLQVPAASKGALDINGNYYSNKRVRISYFAVLFMVCLQVSPYLIPGGPSELTDNRQLVPVNAPPSPPKHIGRNLLWKRDTSREEQEVDYLDERIKQPPPKGQLAYNSSSTLYANMTKSILCKDYFNRTESMRLESELRDWLTRFQLEEKQLLQQEQSKLRKLKQAKLSSNKRLLFDSKYVPIPRLKLWMQKQKYGGDYLSEQFEAGRSGSPEDPESGAGAESLFGLDYESLLATVHRRDDTFYYLSYPSKGHLILPPISNRSDVRPRFSFLIPTFHNLSLDGSPRGKSSQANLNTTNSSGGGGRDSAKVSPQLFILQIDCQVINTKVTLINDDQSIGNKTATDPLRPHKPLHKPKKGLNGK